MTVIELIPEIRSLIGDEDETNYRYTDNVYRDRKIPSGLRRYSLNEFKRFVVSGTDDAAVILPEPDEEQRSMICLYSALAILDGEIVKAAGNAVKVSTPAGSTDLTNVSKELREQRKALLEELNMYRGENVTHKTIKDIQIDNESF